MRDIGDEAATAKRWARVGEWLDAICRGHGCTGAEGMTLAEIRIRLPTEGDPMALMIVKGAIGTERKIAFVGAGTPNQALLAWRKRDGGPGLKWREDRPWQGE